MVRFRLGVLICCLTTFFALQCTTEKDEKIPVVLMEFSGEPIADSVVINTQDGLTISFDFKDDKSLSNARYAINYSSSKTQSICNLESEWSYLEITELADCGGEFEKYFSFPDSLTGEYELDVRVLDEAGNLASKEVLLIIQNEEIPHFNSISVAVDESFDNCVLTTPEQETVTVTIQSDDNQIGVEQVNFFWYLEDKKIGESVNSIPSALNFSLSFNLDFPESEETSFDLKIQLVNSEGTSQWSEIKVNREL